MNFQANSPHARDAAHHLHPYTNMADNEANGPHIFSRGEGIYVYDDDGKKYIEGLAGLWCASLGFSEKRLVEAATKQMEVLPFYHNFAGKSCEPTIELADYLVKHAPCEDMAKVFFTNSGSEANDTQVKIVWYYNNVMGRPEKKKIFARTGAYHGITLAAASMTGLQYAHNAFDVPIKNIMHTTCPHHYHHAEPDESEEAFAQRCADDLEAQIIEEGPETCAAFIAEPFLGAGGVIMPPKGYFEAIQKVLDKYDMLLIVDEVISGFWRTGDRFASETFNLKPDLMTMAKALSAAYLPIGGVMISKKISDVINQGSMKYGLFGTGYTYSGHPVPAAVAVETQKIYDEMNMGAHVKATSVRFQERLKQLGEHPMVGEARGIGLIGGIELVKDKADKINFDPAHKVAPWCVAKLTELGMIARPMINDSIGLCPPLIITDSQVDDMFDILDQAVDITHKEYVSTL
ncbi:MAG: aminotransferase class III-fold pyridoxal phosphate-dependent enzyme [Rhodospirillales bacterium]|jgi:4-aminobutyrate---pyruvate transaminase|nr:aminotransferase class III-fold pyridoxal phosphate-dependent enzyme [Rhodospirillales bacterium]